MLRGCGGRGGEDGVESAGGVGGTWGWPLISCPDIETVEEGDYKAVGLGSAVASVNVFCEPGEDVESGNA